MMIACPPHLRGLSQTPSSKEGSKTQTNTLRSPSPGESGPRSAMPESETERLRLDQEARERRLAGSAQGTRHKGGSSWALWGLVATHPG